MREQRVADLASEVAQDSGSTSRSNRRANAVHAHRSRPDQASNAQRALRAPETTSLDGRQLIEVALQ